MTNHDDVIKVTKQWLIDFVIELNLCPFAKREYVAKAIRFRVINGVQESDLLESLFDEINFLVANKNISTTLLIHPNLLINFDDYNQFLSLADSLLEQHNWSGEFQIASFHPDYRFANTKAVDAENFTNRSPYPMLHILRESLVEQAIANYPDIDQVPSNNIALMENIGSKELQLRLEALKE